MKMLIVAFVIFPASWVAIPSAPTSLRTSPIQVRDTQCSQHSSRKLGGQVWKSARVVEGVRDVAALDQLGDGPVVVVDAQLAGQRLAGHRLSRLCFEGGNLSRTDWRGVAAEEMVFARTDLSDAVMTGASLRHTMFYVSQLGRVRARNADLSGSAIYGGGFDGLILRGALMRGFRFTCELTSSMQNCQWPETRGIDARGADLTRAALDVYSLRKWRLDGAVLDHTAVQFRQIGALRSAVLRGPVLLESSGGTDNRQREAVRLDASEWRQLLWMGRPSFDCGRAVTKVERSICKSDAALETDDRRLADLFRAQLAAGKTTREEQRRWLRTRDACGAQPEGWDRIGCISRAYSDRFDALMERGAVARWIRPGAERLFLSSDLAPPAAFQQTALYRRIFPVLFGTATTRIAVRVRDRLRIEASGDAFGSNGHMCNLAGRSYSFRAASGWFGAPRSADYREFYPNVAAFEDLLRFAGDEVVVGPQDARGNAGEYVMCGARAGFETATAVRVPPEQRAVPAELLDRDI